MKILYLATQPELRLDAKSGYGTHMREMIRAFEQLGHEVRTVIAGDIFASHDLDAVPAKKSGLKKWVPTLLWQSLRDLRRFRSDRTLCPTLEAEIKGFSPDLIYERGSYGSALGVRTARKFGIRHALEWNAPFLEERVALSGRSGLLFLAKRLAHEAKSSTDLAVVVSDRLAQMSQIANLSSRYVVTHNAIRHDFSPPPTYWQRADFGWNEDHTIVGFVGSMFPWHGVDRLIAALPAAVSAHPNLRCLIVGDGEVKPNLEAQVAALGLQRHVHFTGTVPHESAIDSIRLMDLCTLPSSHSYGSPIKLFEYALWAKPILVHNTAPIAEVMTHRTHGFLTPPETFGSALLEVLSQPEEAREWGANWQEKVRTEHTWRRNAQRVLDHLA